MATSFAPDSLKAARLLLLAKLNGLTSAEVGIVGDTAHAATGSSYHLGKSNLRSDSYSIVESSRDRNGLTDAASALDVGEFSHRAGGRTHTLRTFSAWLVAQCQANTPDTRDIREVIYSPDGSTVRRWDRLGKRASGDSSHTFHTHISYFRDSENRDKTALFRRYLIETGIEDDMPTVAEIWQTDGIIEAPDGVVDTTNTHWAPGSFLRDASALARANKALLVQILGKLNGDLVDEQAVIAGVLAGLNPAAIAAAIPAELAEQVADELAARLAS
jgi:hypothetical protein